MGSDSKPDEKPAHKVYLELYYIDKYEVTNFLYKSCVNAGVCSPPGTIDSRTRPNYYTSSSFDNYPVINISWSQAKTLCEWRGADLPTESEWEKVSGWDDENKVQNTYPWGDEAPNLSLLNSSEDTAAVGSYETDKSYYGVYDMADNVSEWVNDWYDVYPSGDPSVSIYFGQKFRVVRGNSYRSSSRNWRDPNPIYAGIGFRCARSAMVDAQLPVTISVTDAKVASLQAEITDTKGIQMVLVSEGEFTMGSENAIDCCSTYDSPLHVVRLSSYYMDKFEVSNSEYKKCVDDKFCKPPVKPSNYYSPSRALYTWGNDTSTLVEFDYYNDSSYGDSPVVYVDWNMANEYCKWRGLRLPTEAEWEKAARGTDKRNYPSGERIDCSVANYGSCFGKVLPVTSYSNINSPYGISNLAGNVMEWVFDWYWPTFL